MSRSVVFRLTACAMLALLCWCAAGPRGDVHADDPIVGALTAAGVDVIQVEAGTGRLMVAFEAPLEADADAMLATALHIMDMAVDLAPDAQGLVVRAHYLGEPTLEIAAQADDVRALREGRIEPGAFAERLGMVDLRTPAAAATLVGPGEAPRGVAAGSAGEGMTSAGPPEATDTPTASSQEPASPPLVIPTGAPAGPGAEADFPDLAPPPWP